MNKIQIANILLTRICNLKCEYCDIVKDYENIPSVYKKINEYKTLSSSRWIDIIKLLKLNNPDIFFILYGGEPFLYPGLSDIIKYCNNNNVNYTIISNNTEKIQPIIEKVLKECGEFKGFTASVDPVLSRSENNDIIKKSKSGFDNLVKYKKSGQAKDVVAEITITKDNIKYVYDTVKALSDNDIWSSITVVDIKKNEYYDFSAVTNEDQCLHHGLEEYETINKIYRDAQCGILKIHIPEVLNELYQILPYDYRCTLAKDVHNITIDADGTLRTCLRIKGIKTPANDIFDYFDKDGNVEQLLLNNLSNDIEKLCEGCNWTCPMFSEHFSKMIIKHE